MTLLAVATQELRPGTVIGGRYRLEAPVGRGGMATVWRAMHTTLDRPVAVKFLEAVGVQATQLAARFLQEAKIAGGIRHRHVVDIQDFGVLDTGQPYMVMELLDGKSLATRYTDGPPVSDWEALEIVAMVLSGLAAVHDAGILHRDVKPENIFLVEDADGVYPKLLDFGVSKGFGSTRLTGTGAVVGTPQYMSPEQARGLKEIDHRSDLFSAGIVLYEAFTGQVPFDSENPGDVLIRVATEDPDPLDRARPDLPPALVRLVHRALDKDPTGRPASAREMRDEIVAILSEAKKLGGRPPSTVIRTTFASGPTTGKIRVLSRPPEPVPFSPVDPSTPLRGDPTLDEPPSPRLSAPRVPREAADLLETEKLSPPRANVRPRVRGRPARWPWVLLMILVLASAVTYAVFDRWETVETWLAAREVSPQAGGRGAVRPGVEVANEAPETSPEALEPPPAEGEPAPPAETVDVPSPPDPPTEVPAEELMLGADPP